MMPSSSPRRRASRLPLALILALSPIAASSLLPSCATRKGACGDARVDTYTDAQKAADASLVDEECDDGNTVDDDECTNACALPKCGDGIIQAANGEACEDEDYGAADRCSPACGAGKVCKLSPSPACVDAPAKGAAVDTDGCTPKCQLDVCNDGYVYQGVEECDDGNNSNTDDCLVTCLTATCGDGFVRKGAEVIEECDDGNDLNVDTCTTECKKPVCGDGYVWAGFEQCDDGNASDGDACPTTCELPACGDGFVDPATEECDDGNDSDSDACLTTCKLATCGDGLLQDGVEECDDGDLLGGDYCDPTCKKSCAGDGAGLFEGHCYLYFPGPLTWAQANCGAIGAHRVSIDSMSENEFVAGLIPTDPDPTNEIAWIGLTDQAVESAWLWQLDQAGQDLEFPSILQWAPMQPDDDGMAGEDCAILKSDGLWYDQPCGETHAIICEHDY